MCSRYYVDVELEKEIMQVVEQVTDRLQRKYEMEGDIHPSEEALVITERDHKLTAETMRWGFPTDDKKLVINARAESALEKKMFSENAKLRRCIIPARGFYEWDKDKNKVTFSKEDESAVYMAGFYDYKDNEERFVIITTEANESMAKTHDRMPLIYRAEEISEWIRDGRATASKLKQKSPQLKHEQDYEQMSLF